jgi:hypothetical protein
MATMATLESSVFIGLNAGVALTTGTDNHVISGIGGGQAITSGSDNAGIGSNVIPLLTTGSNNSALGSDTLAALTTGSANTVVGKGAAPTLATGSGNTVVGALVDVAAGATNVVAIGDGTGQVRYDWGKTTASQGTLTGIHSCTAGFGLAITTVGALPAAAVGNKGWLMIVTDANATATAGVGAVVAAGGANIVPVFSDGTNWRIF